MKIRRLIIKTKLLLTENFFETVFVFHCSGLTSAQWQKLKTVLNTTQGGIIFHPNRRISFSEKKSVQTFENDPKATAKQNTSGGSTNMLTTASLSRLSPFFKALSEQSLQSNMLPLSDRFVQDTYQREAPDGFYSKKHSAKTQCTKEKKLLDSLSKKVFSTQTRGPVCIFYFKKDHKNNWVQLLKQLDSLGYGSQLLLLYGRTNSSTAIMNHIDTKQVMNLQPIPLLSQSLATIQSPIQNLYYYLNLIINQANEKL